MIEPESEGEFAIFWVLFFGFDIQPELINKNEKDCRAKERGRIYSFSEFYLFLL